MGARNTTLGAIVIEQSWASPFNDDKKLVAFSDSVQDAAHRAGFFSARTYLNTVRTGLAQVIDQVATPQCAWTMFLEQSALLWQTKGSPLEMPVERFVSEFIGPNMMWQRDWVHSLQELDQLPSDGQIMIRDDGSRDRTVDVVAAIADVELVVTGAPDEDIVVRCASEDVITCAAVERNAMGGRCSQGVVEVVAGAAECIAG